MPINFHLTIEKFKDYLSDNQIAIILNSSNFVSANKNIIDFLIEGITCKGDLENFYDQLCCKLFYASFFMQKILKELKSG